MGERPESLRGILNRLIAAAADRGAVVYCYGHPLVRFPRPPPPAQAGIDYIMTIFMHIMTDDIIYDYSCAIRLINVKLSHWLG